MNGAPNPEFKFKLSAPITYSQNGQHEESHELVFLTPSMKERHLAAKLKQLVSRAEKNSQQELLSKISVDQVKELEKIQALKNESESSGKDDVENDEAEKANAMKSTILGSDINIEEFYKAFDLVALKVGTVADGVSLKQAHIEALTLKDYENICFGYIVNFIE